MPSLAATASAAPMVAPAADTGPSSRSKSSAAISAVAAATASEHQRASPERKPTS